MPWVPTTDQAPTSFLYPHDNLRRRFVLMLQIRKLRLRAAQELAPGHVSSVG